MKLVDYIIVGQGLAGSTLAFKLMRQNQQVVVIDEEKEFTSSKIAAGLCNPVVFKRLTKSWMIDEVLDVSKNFYRNQEELLKDQFYFDLPIYKLFTSEKEQAFWKQKSNEPELFDWLNPKTEYPFDQEKLEHPFGASHVLNSGFLDTNKWLSAFKEYLIEKQSFLTSTFNYDDIQLTDDGVIWKEYQAKKIIFCEGYQTINNPYFDWLPFKLTKGETLTVNFKNLNFKSAINKGVFILPHNGNYKLGATYNWDDFDEKITEEGKENLLERAGRFIKDEIIIIEHKAGVRPTVKDRRPLIGEHMDHEQLLVFNGLGTKGVMLAPYFAEKVVNLLLHQQPLPEEVNINRFLE